MNRRTFLKSIGLCAPTVGVASLTLHWPSSEMDDIYSFVESKQILTPIQGLIPFKLHGFQRDILRDMHMNDNVVIIKCRQIGITNLMAVYAVWLREHKNASFSYYPCNYGTYQYFYDRFHSYGHEQHNHFCGGPFQIALFDEYNLAEFPDITQLIQDWRKCFPSGIDKIIITGVYDARGSMARTIQENPTFKVVEYPWQRCKEVFSNALIYQIRSIISPRNFAREFECKIV